MRTTKPISTISYNSIEFLKKKLDELLELHRISDYMFIKHTAEEDEKKDHIHLWINPNTLLDSMDLQNYFNEFDPFNPDKPKKCIDFRKTADTDDWILYCQHYQPYLASKFESREFCYSKEDFYFADEDNFDNLYYHAFKASKFAQNNQILEQLSCGKLSGFELIENGAVPLNMATQLNSYMYLKTHYGSLDRGAHDGHD